MVEIRFKRRRLAKHPFRRIANAVKAAFGRADIQNVDAVFDFIALAIGDDEADVAAMTGQRGAHLVEDARVIAGVDGGEVGDL